MKDKATVFRNTEYRLNLISGGLYFVASFLQNQWLAETVTSEKNATFF